MANEKLNLTDEEIIIFENALNDAYIAGKVDVFIAIGPRAGLEARLSAVNEILQNYCQRKENLENE
jgi:hypothetical protein